MTTLHIQVPVNDLPGWKSGFAQHAEMRRTAGVRNELVRHVAGDTSQLVVELDFDTEAEAEAFLGYLRDNVWKDQPILAAPPQATLLQPL